MRTLVGAAVLAGFLAAPGWGATPASAGVEMTLRQSQPGLPDMSATSTLKAQAGVIRIQDEGDPVFLLWNTGKRQFHQVDIEANVCTGGAFDAQLQTMRKFLDELRREEVPGGQASGPDSRPRTSDPPKASFSVAKTGDTADIAGLRAERHLIREGETLRQELWIGAWPALSREVDMAVLRGMQQEWMNIVEEVMSGGDDDPIFAWYLSAEYTRLFENGVVLRQIDYLPEGTMVSETTRTVVRAIPASELSLPAGCRRVTLEEFLEATEE